MERTIITGFAGSDTEQTNEDIKPLEQIGFAYTNRNINSSEGSEEGEISLYEMDVVSMCFKR